MHFASLGSGSKGNATVVKANGTCILIDNGFSLRETELRLSRLGVTADMLTAVLITHEHSDHVRGVGPLARRYRLPVWATRGTAAHPGLGKMPAMQLIDVHQPFVIRDIEIQAFPVPHDAREPCQFVFNDGKVRFGMLTDTGSCTAHIETQLSGCDALLLECNHDSDMLAKGPYPPALKQRVGGRFGHLSNGQAARLLANLDTSCLRHIVAAHLSEQNNTVEHARDALSRVLDCDRDEIDVANQASGLGWREI
ncbi:MAG: MBL fold metallo-hydrolase [Proteobacteria bacterium]|nr:MBL fold metallo-hydrolase [Pseudomonadota bacterium]MCG6934871.1 MBL fold metallo-hydrolase [Pseudomonadota bacterium]